MIAFNPSQPARELPPLVVRRYAKRVVVRQVALDMNGNDRHGSYFGRCGRVLYRIEHEDATHAHFFSENAHTPKSEERRKLRRFYHLAKIEFAEPVGLSEHGAMWDHSAGEPIISFGSPAPQPSAEDPYTGKEDPKSERAIMAGLSRGERWKRLRAKRLKLPPNVNRLRPMKMYLQELRKAQEEGE